MKAVVYKGNGIICLEERPLPEIQKDTDAIVKVTMTTIMKRMPKSLAFGLLSMGGCL